MCEAVCSLWQDPGCGSFIKMLTRPHGQWTHCSSCCPLHSELCFSFCFPLSLNHSLCIFLSVPPSSPPLSTETFIGLDCHSNRKPTNTDPFFIFSFHLPLFSLSSFVLYSFFCPVVSVSVLFRFNLNTFQLCMNQAVLNLIMLRHGNDTELC